MRQCLRNSVGAGPVTTILSIIAGKDFLVKELFRIQNNKEPVQPVLLLQAGDDHLAFAITNKDACELAELAYCTLDSINSETLNEILSQYPVLKNQQFYDTQVSFATSQAVLVPATDAGTADAEIILNSRFGKQEGGRIVSELIPEWQFYNAYKVDNTLWEWVHTIFPFAKFRHQYSLGLKQVMAADEEGGMWIEFGRSQFSVLAAAGGKILLANSYEYTTPDDVLFVLLKICQQFSLSQQAVDLWLCGLIDRQSALYKELYQYFLNIEFRESGWHAASQEYPSHFFTSLNDLASCVS